MSPVEPIPAGNPCWAELSTSDAAKSKEFYGRLFGWDAVDEGEEYGGYNTFRLGGAVVGGCMQTDGSNGPANIWSVYLATTNAEATAKAAEANGGQVFVPPMQLMDLGTMVFLGDPGGAAVGAWQPDRNPGFEVLGEVGSPGWFELHTRAYPETVKFYETVFGWDTYVKGDTPEFRYTTLGDGETQAAGIMDASGFLPEGVPAHWSIYFRVADADATVRKVEELGGTVVMAPENTPYGLLATALDTTGTQFKIIQTP